MIRRTDIRPKDMAIFWILGGGGAIVGVFAHEKLIGFGMIAMAIGWVLYRASEK